MGKFKLIGVAGQGGAGKDTFYEHVLKPRGFLRWQMTLHYKVWLVSTGRATWREVFDDKPPHVRKILQEEITALRHEWSESIWLDTFTTWLIALRDIVGVGCAGIALIDVRFLIEMRGMKHIGGKILHIEAADQQSNIAPELRGHRSETELQSPEVLTLRDGYIYNLKRNREDFRRQGEAVLKEWGWA